eukprot:CAMPEP_0197394572 /NCGR_PEP_ID=MMETSP1165-20131217/5519_1 /TAXON_ID=284809 /ORGANISM="Chrysocystis fragilis, Strain CCMP3189" /LENGTH=43 /DNA_ID= /DNA_START= /DNA_END= /DNA_ORIENTATION=
MTRNADEDIEDRIERENVKTQIFRTRDPACCEGSATMDFGIDV